ncbi:ternary complex factor MIP1 protein [Tanacetum coccineum]
MILKCVLNCFLNCAKRGFVFGIIDVLMTDMCGVSFGVATLRAVVHAGDKTSGDARSWCVVSKGYFADAACMIQSPKPGFSIGIDASRGHEKKPSAKRKYTEEELEEYMNSHKKRMIDSLWKLNMANIKATLSHVLQDPTVKKEELRARAKGPRTLDCQSCTVGLVNRDKRRIGGFGLCFLGFGRAGWKFEVRATEVANVVGRTNMIHIKGLLPSRADDPNKISESILKCLINIIVRMSSLRGKSMTETLPSLTSTKTLKETEVNNPYGIGFEYGKRDIGPYKHLYAIEGFESDKRDIGPYKH